MSPFFPCQPFLPRGIEPHSQSESASSHRPYFFAGEVVGWWGFLAASGRSGGGLRFPAKPSQRGDGTFPTHGLKNDPSHACPSDRPQPRFVSPGPSVIPTSPWAY